ncbi:hypothetical protein HNV10_01755 [Winogradskyella litoriviva]|uniref:Outer membrane protein beta-barrel domain-containing protein n=1 Tax=Winogradskyella litoriviva TaxID=1220182 RepID=A0ABX2E0D3_9FLAO|nr:hypothetical protein [Winogradskyella litoriviva]NRD21947.1 hypothetical protein [Winogradskyella litoriviva]
MRFKRIILALLLCSLQQVSGQTTDFFNDYHKLSFQFGVSRYVGAESTPLPNTLIYKFRDYTSPHFGFYYDILQTRKFNFKIGLSALLVRDYIEYKIDKNEIPNVDRDLHLYVEDNTGSWRFNIPIIGEYLVSTKLGKLSFNGGLILGYSEEFGETLDEHGIRAHISPEPTTTSSIYSRRTAPWYINSQFGIGMYFPFKKWMLRTNLYYNFALQDLYDGEFTFSNLSQSPDTSGNFSFRGDSFGLEFSIYLKKTKRD